MAKNTTEKRDFTIEIVGSSKELTKIDRVKFKDTSAFARLDEVSRENPNLIFSPDYWVEIMVHNENAKDDKDYRQLIVVDTDGNKYITGSRTFIESFKDIFHELEGEVYDVQVLRRESKNYKGKDYLVCCIV